MGNFTDQLRTSLVIGYRSQHGKHPPELTVGGCFCLEPTVGVEPTTCRLRIGCSTSELRWRKDPAAVSLLQGLAARNLWWPGADLNRRHHDFQSCALPTELPGHVRDEP